MSDIHKCNASAIFVMSCLVKDLVVWLLLIMSMFLILQLYVLVHLFIRSFVHSFIHLLIYSLSNLFTFSFIHSFIYSFIHSFIQKSIHEFIHSFSGMGMEWHKRKRRDLVIHVWNWKVQNNNNTDLMLLFTGDASLLHFPHTMHINA